MALQIIYTETEMLLSKEEFANWREIQDRYIDFETSLGPWESDAVIEYLADQYQSIVPSAADQVLAFLESANLTRVITFK